ncbi:MAG: electron transport complex subunit RsxC [Oscillospiraceae bacterium]|nr:electron transport complex subunit RsxC [Oscillospiraceae bacterium]
MRRLRGARLPHNKNTAGSAPEALPTPQIVRIPMSMHIGAPAKPVVSAGDSVKVGQLIGEAGGAVSAPVHSSVSGKVRSIDEYDPATGQKATSITIEADGEQTLFEGIEPKSIDNAEQFLDAVRESGVVGLGGAGFPTAVKLTVREGAKLDCIIINGAECEPYITSDTRTMIDDARLIKIGISLLSRFYKVESILIGVENNKPEAIGKMEEIAEGMEGVEVRRMPSRYPQGGEKVLIYNLTGRIVPEGGLPLDVGVIVLNCTTLAAIARYIETGVPLVSKCVTVDGSAVKVPKNVIAPIGTPVSDLFEFCGGLTSDAAKVLYGGPMMGVAIPGIDMPVLKNTNAVLAFRRSDAKLPPETACIRCGRCAANCPMGLAAAEIERAFLLKKKELLELYKVGLCMECGCCAYNCPARRPLVQSIKLGKAMLRG